MGWAYFQMGWAYFQIGWAYFWMGWAYFQGRRFLKIRPPPSLSSHISSSPMGIFSRLRYYQATLIKAKHFMHFRSWQTRPESEKEFWDGLLHFTCRKLKKQREMPLPMHSPIPFLNFSCYRWDGICAWVMAFPLAPCFFTFFWEVEYDYRDQLISYHLFSFKCILGHMHYASSKEWTPHVLSSDRWTIDHGRVCKT